MVSRVVLVVVLLIPTLNRCRQRADSAVGKHEGQTFDLPPHAREGPVAGRCTAGHRTGYVRKVDAIGSQVVRTDQHLERVGVINRPINRNPADQRGHGHRPHQRRVLRQGVGTSYLLTLLLLPTHVIADGLSACRERFLSSVYGLAEGCRKAVGAGWDAIAGSDRFTVAVQGRRVLWIDPHDV
ncbi:hypothetical protein ALP24_02135 [Pseudomonas syringae pv. aptata]|uniref:Uncharacterized protein n=1 Tax=Pseudomonas syringae pv. aptata TaxID=83167 RepID=A0A3M5XAT2_PSEAP|nr:hypothetical protein ALP24_02135 [Pseudomonas syringae pv. aptata]